MVEHDEARDGDEKQADLNATAILLAGGKKTINARTTAYVCENGTCSLPAESTEAFAERLKKSAGQGH